MQLELDEVRRLTGPNLLWDKPGAIVDVLVCGIEPAKVAETWQEWMKTILTDFGWQEQYTYRLHDEGASMALSAPMDALYTACELAELAWHCAAARLSGENPPDWNLRLAELKQELAEEQNSALISLMNEAEKRGVTCISDDDDVSLGMGRTVDIWPARQLPTTDQVDWQKYHDIPRAFVTGTNGKSTSVRLAAQIAKAAGINAGVTSTDFIRVGDEIIDTGDYSGPGGARMLLRDPRTELAFLEVARGGILRRGIPVETVDAALITNVASDHLGQYGINKVEELAQVKFVITKGLTANGTLVVNADNELSVAEAGKLDQKLCWFSTDEFSNLIQQQIKDCQPAVFVRAGHIVYHSDGLFEDILPLVEIPMTMGGAAKHNVQNALGVIGLCKALKLPIEAIRQGLREFGSSAVDNPGRGNLYKINGATVMVDFAHNEHSMRAVVETARNLPGKRKIAMFSHAGDRSDEEIRDLTKAVAGLKADMYIVSELERYLRGRELGEIPAIVRDCLVELAVPEDKVKQVSEPLEGTKLSLQNAQSGDLILLFVLSDREIVHDYLSALSE